MRAFFFFPFLVVRWSVFLYFRLSLYVNRLRSASEGGPDLKLKLESNFDSPTHLPPPVLALKPLGQGVHEYDPTLLLHDEVLPHGLELHSLISVTNHPQREQEPCISEDTQEEKEKKKKKGTIRTKRVKKCKCLNAIFVPFLQDTSRGMNKEKERADLVIIIAACRCC